MDQGVTKGTEGSGFICQPCFVTANAKTCAHCGEAITSGKTLQSSDGKYYHEACWEAHKAAGGNKTRTRTSGGQNKPSTDNICAACGQEIRSNSHKVRMAGAVYHKECLRCASCNADLNKQQPFQVDGHLMCKPCAETNSFPTCKHCGKLIKAGQACVEDSKGNQYHEACYDEKTKADHITCDRCSKVIKSGAIIRDVDLHGQHNGKVYCKPCWGEKNRESDAAHAAEVRKSLRDSEKERAGMPNSAAAGKSLKQIEAGLAPGQGLVAVGGELTTVTRHTPSAGQAVGHAGGKPLPEAMEQDLAKVKRESAADRISKQVETNAALVGQTIEGIRFEKQGFCNADLIGDFKKRDIVIGTKEGTYKKTFSGKIQVVLYLFSAG